MYQKSNTKLWKQFEITNYNLCSRFGNDIHLFHGFELNSQTVAPSEGEKLWETEVALGKQLDCSPRSHEISAYSLPVMLTSPNGGQLYEGIMWKEIPPPPGGVRGLTGGRGPGVPEFERHLAEFVL